MAETKEMREGPAEMRWRAEWIRDHSPEGASPRMMVAVPDVLELVARLEAADAALARVTDLHARETLTGLVVGDCAMEECDHEGECPRTGSIDVCAACLRLAEEAVSHYGEDGYGDEVLWPCATMRAISGALMSAEDQSEGDRA
ncbi:hypothetical protein [Agrococcus sp. Marseille-Q4369]|uniref:hypothetical protein n=1 Tax=Agrococcus sp. Marseille-Q4369 TaxID=2810513 RepID=UPI001B8BC7F8|nr:hypothetical protein [Agrococcus sp. Marseille-Q4369]QUW18879.1 hypothetical protein JSQ78_00385 [Agrococcus sp. Marseille-Q4369]